MKKILLILMSVFISIVLLYLFIHYYSIPVSGEKDFSFTISEKYLFSRNNSNSVSINHISGRCDLPKIDTFVDSLGFDDNFILSKQVRPEKVATNEIVPQNIPPKNEMWYWIIDIKADKLYGPYKNLNEFSIKKDELKVSKNITLKPYTYYKNKK